MNREEIDYVQSSIGYQFKNLKLLYQAFMRKSYSAEHPEAQDNEVLEFYGDEVLDLYVTKMMYKKFSKLKDGELVSEKNEGELTKLKSAFVSKETLANCVHNFGFEQFLYLGNSDIKNEAQKSVSVNEDLFEAIVGAVAVDCDWDFSVLEKVCETMLQMETVNNYLLILVKEKSHALGFGEPEYHPRIRQGQGLEGFRPFNLWETRLGIDQFNGAPNPKTGLYEYGIKIGKHFFIGIGKSPYQAKMNADQKAYTFLLHEEMKQKIKTVDYENPVSQLHEFVQKKIILEPRYEFFEYHDSDGNPIWRCTVSLEGVRGNFVSEGISKKEVKQEAALQLLKAFVDSTVNEDEEWETPVIYMGGARFWSDEKKKEMEDDFNRAFPNWEKGL